MFEINGKYNVAKIFADTAEDTAIGQIIELCNQSFTKGMKIRMMPDLHAGAGCVIGTTIDFCGNKKVVPNLVGVDIGCGVIVAKLTNKEIDFEKLDESIRFHIPHGQGVHNNRNIHQFVNRTNVKNLHCYDEIHHNRIDASIGTLGGGNHFIEIDIDDNGNYYLLIHSGSRNLGKQVAEYWQNKAIEYLKDKARLEKNAIVSELKSNGNEHLIQESLNNHVINAPKDALCYLEGENFDKYLHDIYIAQEYANINREAMLDDICKMNGFEIEEVFTTVHNYIGKDEILRKGAVSAKKDEKIVIPINMRDGSIIALGKGNANYNNSAPHGAGRLFSRSKAKQNFTLEEFENSMKGIFSTSIRQSTLDESPMAYKPIESIVENIEDTAEILEIIKPVYNFKA